MTQNVKTTRFPPPQQRYVVTPAMAHGEDELRQHLRHIQDIIRDYGKIALRFEVRYWQPDKRNNTTWPGTVNVHCHDVETAAALVRAVRDLLVGGQRVEKEGER